MSYDSDGLCHNSEAGWFNQECERPAKWIGTLPSGMRSGFCDECKEHGREARQVRHWEAITDQNRGPVVTARLGTKRREMQIGRRAAFFAIYDSANRRSF